MYADDTIAAIATAAGSSGVGVVRVSGPASQGIVESVFSGSHPVEEWVSHRLYYGIVSKPSGGELDRGLAVLMRAPHSYTGEDVAELHCHGSPVILQQVLQAVLIGGARLAEPGEFTKRAFLNGRVDLAQAEAVIDAVQARTPQAAGLAVRQLSGALSTVIHELREQATRLKALVEAQIDFSEEDFTIATEELLAQLATIEQPLEKLLSTYEHGKLIRDGLRVVIVGRPNVGKSSLLNALLGEERAIVTPHAGTTRDVIEESINLAGTPLVLADTAGLRDQLLADPVEAVGMQRTQASIREANLLLVVLDASQPLTEQDRSILQATQESPRVLVLNKSDLPKQLSDLEEFLNGDPCLAISAVLHHGMEDLRTAIGQAANLIAPVHGTPVITRARHQVALACARDSLALVRQSITEGQPCDLIAVDIQDALDHLSSITGAVTNEDVLDRIFKEFCVGK